jgi:hypothetical protein
MERPVALPKPVLALRRHAATWSRLETRDKILFLVAGLLVVTVRVGLWILPFRVLYRISRKLCGAMAPRSRWNTADVIWAVRAMSARVPHASCLTQALAAQVLLSWNDQRPDLRIGVARSAAGVFEAHAWVEWQGKILIGGGRSHSKFTALPHFDRILK